MILRMCPVVSGIKALAAEHSCKLGGGASILDLSVHHIPYIPAFDLGNLVVDRSHCLDFDQSSAVQPHMQQNCNAL